MNYTDKFGLFQTTSYLSYIMWKLYYLYLLKIYSMSLKKLKKNDSSLKNYNNDSLAHYCQKPKSLNFDLW